MSKNTTATVALLGKTANELRELLASKQVTAKAVVAFLREREAERGELRAPSKKLLDELTGEKTEVKPVAQKPEPVKAEVKPVAKADDSVLADLLAQVRVLTERVAALEGVKPKPVKVAKVQEPKAAPAKGPNPTSLSQKSVEKLPTEERVREGLNEMSLAELRERAKEFEVPVPAKGSKDAVIDAIIADAIANGVIVAAAPVKVGKPDLKVVRSAEVEF